MRHFNKIFGIGFHKTCTTSLAQSLECIGIPAFHWWAYKQIRKAIKSADWEASIWSERRAFTDLPIPIYYQLLDENFPNSLFILTIRDSQKWKVSVARHMKDYTSLEKEGRVHASELHGLERGLYKCQEGSMTLDECVQAYEKHNKEVMNYFANRQNDLLIIDLTEPGQWGKITSFLDCPVPKQEFPHLNSGG